MDKQKVEDNQSIQEGLERFLDQEINAYGVRPDEVDMLYGADQVQRYSGEGTKAETARRNVAGRESGNGSGTNVGANQNQRQAYESSSVRSAESGRSPESRELDRRDSRRIYDRDLYDERIAAREYEPGIDSSRRDSERRSSDRKENDRRDSGRKNSDSRDADRRDSDRRDSDRRNSNKRSSDKRSSDKRSSDRRNSDRRNSGRSEERNTSGRNNSKRYSEEQKRGKKSSDRREDKRGKKTKEKKKSGALKKLAIFVVVLFLLMFVFGYFFVGNMYDKMNYEKAEGISKESMKEDGVANILLIGNDSREKGDDGRSDAMILVSVSDKTNTIHMTSLLRDMYVEIPGHGGNRLNAAYAYGGPTLLCETIEQNFGIEVNRYALVNFQAFANLVDGVNGVDLELSNEEVQWVNAYLNEYNLLEGKEMTTDYLDPSLSGVIHLNGPQALAYSRNRYIGTDFGRTERQRKVLSAVMKKAPLAMATNPTGLIDGILPNLTTNLTQMEVYSLSLKSAKLAGYEVVQGAIPAEGTYQNATIRKMAVLEVDFDANKKILQQEIYGKEADNQVTSD